MAPEAGLAVCWAAMTRIQKLFTAFFGLMALAAFGLRMMNMLATPPDRPPDRPAAPRPGELSRPG